MLSLSAASRMVRSRSGKRSLAQERGDTVGTNPASHGLSCVLSSGSAGSRSALMSRGCALGLGSASLSQLPDCRSGPGGRRFKSCLPDQFKAAIRFGKPNRSRPALFVSLAIWTTGGPNRDEIGPPFREPRAAIAEAQSRRYGSILNPIRIVTWNSATFESLIAPRCSTTSNQLM